MKNQGVILLTILMGLALSASAASRSETSEETKAKILRTAESISRLGGLAQKPGSGRFALVSKQTTYTKDELEKCRELYRVQLRYPVEIVESETPFTLGTASGELSKTGLSVGIYLVEDPSLPMSMVAMEEHWAMVNTLRVAEGAKDNDKKIHRLKRELSRVIKALLMGGTTAKDTKAVRVGSDLESITGDPIDGQQLFNIIHSMPSFGLVAPRIVPYRRACQEGWAPAPTNDIQKAVWNEVHAIPQKPIKIEFDPKTDTK